MGSKCLEGVASFVIEIGNHVVCDYCNEDWTDRAEKGGLLFGSYAACPDCEQHQRDLAKKYNEESHILAECPAYMSFYNWVLTLR